MQRRVALFLACTSVTSALPDIKMGAKGNARELSLSAPSPPPECNGPCYAVWMGGVPWSTKCVPGFIHGCKDCPECQDPPSTPPPPQPPSPPPPPLTPGGAWLTEVDVVLTLRNLTAEAFEGIGNGEVDYRAEYYREIERTRSSTLV